MSWLRVPFFKEPQAGTRHLSRAQLGKGSSSVDPTWAHGFPCPLQAPYQKAWRRAGLSLGRDPHRTGMRAQGLFPHPPRKREEVQANEFPVLPAHPALPVWPLASSVQISFPRAASSTGWSGECQLGQTSASTESFLKGQTPQLRLLCPPQILLLSFSRVAPCQPAPSTASPKTHFCAHAGTDRGMPSAVPPFMPSSALTDC